MAAGAVKETWAYFFRKLLSLHSDFQNQYQEVGLKPAHTALPEKNPFGLLKIPYMGEVQPIIVNID